MNRIPEPAQELLNHFAILALRDWVHAEVWAAFYEHQLVVWWNGSATFQVCNPTHAMKVLRRGGHQPIPILAAWQDTANHRDATVAKNTIVALTDTTLAELPWQPEEGMESYREVQEQLMGPCVLMPGEFHFPVEGP